MESVVSNNAVKPSSHLSMPRKVIIIGGHGNISLRLARQLSPTCSVTSVIRDKQHEEDITATKATPLLLSLEEASVADFSNTFEGFDVVYFSAGAGGKGGEERTKAVDYEGALKIFDAVEGVTGPKPRLILVSAIDVRDPQVIPAHYNEKDIEISKQIRTAIPGYMHWKYEADKNLAKRTAFKWTILRPGGLTDNPGTGKASIGKTHLGTITRDDVAKTLALLVDREDAAGLAIDLVSGDEEIETALDEMIKKGESDFSG